MPRPWEYQPPRYLYKYFPPERISILTQCAVRFSPRQAFDDDHELRPDVAAFGSEAELREYCQDQPMPQSLREAVLDRVLNAPGEQRRLLEIARGHMQTPDLFGVFCMSADYHSARMWREYAAQNRGFVVKFDTRHPAFRLFKQPGKLGRVEYSDEPIGTFLGMMAQHGAGIFFRKRTHYQFDAEWRSIRAFERLRRAGSPDNPIYLSLFHPASIGAILIRPQCSIEWEAIARRH